MPKPSLSSKNIQGMLQQRWGTISHFGPLAEGLNSQIFGFRHGAANYVVRVNQSIDGFTKDRFVYHSFASRTCRSRKCWTLGTWMTRMPSASRVVCQACGCKTWMMPTYHSLSVLPSNWWRRSQPRILEERTGLDDSIPLESVRSHAGMIF